MDEKVKRYAFKYVRLDGKEVMTDFFPTREEASGIKRLIEGAGGICSDIIEFEISGLGPEIEESYIDRKVRRFQNYFRKELSLLRQPGVSYYIAYDFLKTAIQRIELYVRKNVGPDEKFFENLPPTAIGKNLPPEERKRILQEREDYLLQVAEIIKEEANSYSPLDGSFWESVADELNKLAKEVNQTK